MSVEMLQQDVQRAVQHRCVRIQKAEVPSRRALDPLVVGDGKAHVSLVPHQDDSRRQSFETRDILRRRGIVNDQDFEAAFIPVLAGKLLPLKRGNSP
jgi:hypothetical protein